MREWVTGCPEHTSLCPQHDGVRPLEISLPAARWCETRHRHHDPKCWRIPRVCAGPNHNRAGLVSGTHPSRADGIAARGGLLQHVSVIFTHHTHTPPCALLLPTWLCSLLSRHLPLLTWLCSLSLAMMLSRHTSSYALARSRIMHTCAHLHTHTHTHTHPPLILHCCVSASDFTLRATLTADGNPHHNPTPAPKARRCMALSYQCTLLPKARRCMTLSYQCTLPLKVCCCTSPGDPGGIWRLRRRPPRRPGQSSSAGLHHVAPMLLFFRKQPY